MKYRVRRSERMIEFSEEWRKNPAMRDAPSKKQSRRTVYRFVGKILPIAVSCVCLAGYVLGEWIFNSGLIASSLNGEQWEWAATLLELLVIPGAALFPVAVAFTFRHRPFSEKWLILILEAAAVALLLQFGPQNPFVDDPFYDQPWLGCLDTVCSFFVVAALFQGPALLAAHFVWRNKRRPPVPLRRRMCSLLISVLLSAALLTAYWKLLEISC